MRQNTGTVFHLIKNLLKKYTPERIKQKSIARVMESYDMVADQNEKFFLLIYNHFIEKRIEQVFRDNKINILDAGCGQGRIAIPLAKQGHSVTGIELSPKVADLARKYALRENISLDLITGDLKEQIKKIESAKFDCLVCTEVLYMIQDYEMILKEMVRVLKPGGLLFLSLRPRLFYIRNLTMNKDFEQAARLAVNNECFLNGGWLNCLSKSEMIKLFIENKLSGIEVRGIGVLSGISGDPQAQVVIPGNLDEKQQNLLFQMELKLSSDFPENGRYVLISGINNESRDD